MEAKRSGGVVWNGVFIKPLGENIVSFKDEEIDINPNLQAHFTNTRLTAKRMDDEDKLTVFIILKNVGFHGKIPKIGLKSARMKEALYNLPKVIAKIRNPPLPRNENIEKSDDLEGEGVKIIIPLNLIDMYNRLEILLGLKLSSHSDTLTEASNLTDELYKRGEIQNEQQFRNVLINFQA